MEMLPRMYAAEKYGNEYTGKRTRSILQSLNASRTKLMFSSSSSSWALTPAAGARKGDAGLGGCDVDDAAIADAGIADADPSSPRGGGRRSP